MPPVGDINGTEKGSGARFNDGKPAAELLPLRLVSLAMSRPDVADAMLRLGHFQERNDVAPTLLLKGAKPDQILAAARVLDYGRAKYAAWNWSRGMPWSVTIGCAARHLIAIEQGEENDAESGLPHWGHFWANVLFLATWQTTYPEGDDRPPLGTLGKPMPGSKPASIADLAKGDFL